MNSGRQSPIFEAKTSKSDLPKMVRNGDIANNGMYKIHRIRLCRMANCIVSNVISPSCIWVKLTNHITEQLQTTDLNDLVELNEVREGQYVMAPLENGLYARARVIQLAVGGDSDSCASKVANYAKVLFIDEGTTGWLAIPCLAKMDPILSYHPWQAIAVSLFKIRPKNGLDWSEEECEALRMVLANYAMFRIEVVLSTQQINNYRDIMKVNMIGIEKDKDILGSSIAHIFARQCRCVLFDHALFDGSTQKVYPTRSDADENVKNVIQNREIFQLEYWKQKLPEQKAQDNRQGMEEYTEWNENAAGPQIDVIDLNWLKKQGYIVKDDRCFVNAEGRYTVSPYEFYVRPLLMKRAEEGGRRDISDDNKENEDYFLAGGDRVDDAQNRSGIQPYSCAQQIDAMIAANDELLKLADDLNAFYGHPTNRKPICVQRVKDALDHGRSVYGVAEVDGEVARFMGCWQRVEIIGLKAVEKTDEYYCRVRFLDSGGTDIRLLSSVIEIYPVHCERAPLCLQVCLHGIKPSQGDDWSPAARHFFSQQLRDDVPISLKVVGILNRRSENTRLIYESTAFRRANVIFVSHIQVFDGTQSSETLEARLVEQGYAVWSENSPPTATTETKAILPIMPYDLLL